MRSSDSSAASGMLGFTGLLPQLNPMIVRPAVGS